MKRWHTLIPLIPLIPAALVIYLAPQAHSTGEKPAVLLAQAPPDRVSPRGKVTPTAAPTPTMSPASTAAEPLRTDLEVEIFLSKQKATNSIPQTIRPVATPTPQPVVTYQGQVVDVVDGDTIIVRASRRRMFVRLYGIDCPELDQSFGMAAKQFTTDVALNQDVEVISRRTDAFGRRFATVNIQETCLNDALVINGQAWQSKPPEANADSVQVLEQAARNAQRGLWADAAPIAPWAWRKAKLESLKAPAAPTPTTGPTPIPRDRRHDSRRERERG